MKKAQKKKFNSVLTYVLTYVSEYSEYDLSDSITHTHGFSRAMLLTLLILTGFHGPCYSLNSYSRVFMGHAYSRTHTHEVLSQALLILTHTHSHVVSFLTLSGAAHVISILHIWRIGFRAKRSDLTAL